MSINAGTVYSELVLDMNRYEQGLRQAEQQMNAFASRMEAAGKKMEQIGKDWTKKVTLPIVGLGTAATKVGSDFQAGMSEVQAISGATGDDLAALTEKAKQMGATTKFSASESAEALKYMSMAGWQTEQMLGGLEGIMSLAAASGEELGLVSDIVTDALTAFGMQASDSGKFADLLASASSNANTNVAMMGETFKYVAPVAGALGYSAEDTALAIGLMANSGIKASMAGTSLRQAILGLQGGVELTGKSFGKWHIEVENTDGTTRDFKDVIIDLREAFGQMTEAEKAANAETIAGKVGMSGLLAIVNASEADFNKLSKATSDYTGTAKEMAEIMEDNLQGNLTKLKSALEGVGIQIFEILLPHLEKVIAKFQEWTDKFASLDKETQETIVKMAGLAAAIGPVLLISGKMATSVSSIIGLFTKFSAASTTATAATGATATGFSLVGAAAKAGALLLNPWVLGIGAATVAGVALYKHLQEDSIPAIELFSEEVSENTQKAVGGFLELNDKATVALNQLAWSGQAVTEEMKTNIVDKFEQMGQQVLSNMQSDHAEQLATMQSFFDTSAALTDLEEAEIIANMQKHQQEQADKVTEGQKQIAEILELAKEEKRSITDAERNVINGIQKEMTETAIEYMSENEREQVVILERLKMESSKISAEQAAEVVRNSKAQKDGVVVEAEEQYNKTIAEIIKQRDEAGTISEEQANKLLEEATRQRNGTIQSAEEMHQRVVEEAKAQAGEHVNEVEWSTGEIKSKWKVMTEQVVSDAKDFGQRLGNTMSELGADILKTWDNVRTGVPEKVDEMSKWVNNKWEELRDDTITWGKNMVEGLWNGITEKATWLYDKVTGFVEGIKEKFTGPDGFDMHSPSRLMMEYGRYIDEGLALGIDNNADKPIGSTNTLAENIGTAMKKVDTFVTNTVGVIDKQFELWKLKNLDLKDSSEELSMQLEMQKEKHELLTEQVRVAETALADIVAKYGESSDEALKYKDTLLGLQVRQQGLTNSIEDTTKALKDMAKQQSKLTMHEKTDRARSVNSLVEKGIITQDFWDKHNMLDYVGGYATGTDYASQGLHWVGEEGPELIDFKGGEKVYTNRESVNMAKTSSGGITQNINIYSPTPLSPSEIARQNLRASRQLAMEWGV